MNDASCDHRRRPDAYKGARHEDHLPRDARAQRLEVPKGTPARTWLVWKIEEGDERMNDASCDHRRRPDAYKGARHEDHLPRDARAQRLEVPKGTPARTWLVENMKV